MVNSISYFAETAESPSGIGAFNLNVKSFLFQLITFVIVLLFLRRWVLPKIMGTLEERRMTLEKSLVQARETEESLQKAEAKAAEMIAKTRGQADQSLADIKKKAEEIVAQAEVAGEQRASYIIKEAEVHLEQERNQLRSELRTELAALVATATERVVRQKLDEPRDRALIEESLKELV